MHVGAETLHGGWVGMGRDGCELVGKWFAGCVEWCVSWLVPPTPTPPTTHQHFSVKRCASAQNTWKVGVWVTKWKKQYPGVNNKYVYEKKISNPSPQKINNTHQLHQVQTGIFNHHTKCKKISKWRGGRHCIDLVMSSLGVVVVKGKTSHLLLGGENGWWYQPRLWYLVYPNSWFFCFFYREFVSLYVRTWYLSATMVVYSCDRMICKA